MTLRTVSGTIQEAQYIAATRKGLLETFVRPVWILDEDAEYRAAVVMAIESAGYLLAHRPSEAPALAVIDSWTARFDARRIHGALSGIPLVI